MSYRDAELVVTVGGLVRPFVLRTPETLAARPGLLIYLSLSARQTLEELPYATVPGLFGAAGHYVATYDLPQHGTWTNDYGEGLTGMASAVAAGHDVFADAVAIGRAVVDACLARQVGAAGGIVVAGGSRGALCALHLLAADPRIAAGAGFAPVTDLPTLTEFAALRGSPIVQRANALALAPRLADRPVWLAIKEHDARVGTAQCRAFFAALDAATPPGVSQELRIEPGDTHTMSDESYQAGGAWLLDRLARA
jgi:dienelactone hydrolase